MSAKLPVIMSACQHVSMSSCHHDIIIFNIVIDKRMDDNIRIHRGLIRRQ